MNPEVEKMTPDEFATWAYAYEQPPTAQGWLATIGKALARRDAYREREALKAAVYRAKKAFLGREKVPVDYGDIWDDLRVAILGEPRFALADAMKSNDEKALIAAAPDLLALAESQARRIEELEREVADAKALLAAWPPYDATSNTTQLGGGHD